MASRKKVTLSDYDMTTTLGTGNPFRFNLFRVLWKGEASQKQEDRGFFRYENFEEG